jgi:hypothetical protein
MAKFHLHAADIAASFMVIAHPMTPCLRAIEHHRNV